MLQRKEKVNNIEKLRCICILEGDKNIALKHVARTAMKDLEKNDEGFSEMQYVFRKRKNIYTVTLAVVSIYCIGKNRYCHSRHRLQVRF